MIKFFKRLAAVNAALITICEGFEALGKAIKGEEESDSRIETTQEAPQIAAPPPPPTLTISVG